MIESFLDYLQLEKNYAKHTITAYKADLISFKDFLEVEFQIENLLEVHYSQIRHWIVSLVNQKLSNRSINRKISSLKSFYKFQQKTGQVNANPLTNHKVLKTEKKLQIPFSVDEVDKVLKSITSENDFVELRNKLIVELFYSTGMRRAELIGLKESSIDLNNQQIKVLGKRNKERYVPLLNPVVDTLKKYLKKKKELFSPNESLLITEKNNKIYETLVYRIINSYFSTVSSKVKKSPHMLRHSFATHLINEGADLNSVKELLGHSSLAATQVYTHNSLEKVKKSYNQAHPRSNKTN